MVGCASQAPGFLANLLTRIALMVTQKQSLFTADPANWDQNKSQRPAARQAGIRLPSLRGRAFRVCSSLLAELQKAVHRGPAESFWLRTFPQTGAGQC